jgi:methyl coenzyme M reductase beta subunit
MEPRIHRFPAGTGPYAVEVRNPAGSVTVDAVEDAPEYVVEIEALNTAAEEMIDRVDLFLVGSRLRVQVPERRLQLRSPAFAVRVTTPAAAAARIAVASADVELRGELAAMADWMELDAVSVTDRGDLARDLQTVLGPAAEAG